MISAFTRPARSLCKILSVVALVSSSLYVRAQVHSAGELHGKVCDESGKPIASARVSLQAEGQQKPLQARTGADGNYSFASLPSGNYTLQFAAPGFRETRFSSIPVAAEAKTFDVILQGVKAKASLPGDAPQFFDQPQFTVSGVTDTTDMGGHGSAPITRNREAVEKDVTSLSGNPSPSSRASSSPYDLAVASANAGEYARARDQLQKLLAQQPTSQAHHLLAVVDEKLGNSLEAVHEYQRAAELDPSEPNTFDWGSELLLHHAPEPAIEVFTKGSHLFPNSSRMLIGLGSAEFASGANEQAVQTLCKASDLHPDDPVPYVFLGKVQRTEKTVSAEVVDRFQRFVTLRPDSADANYLYAAALWRQNQPTPSEAVIGRVESLLKAAIRVNPKFADAYLQLGVLHAYQHDSAAATADFQHAIENHPNLEEAHYRLAQAYRAAGRIDDAKTEVGVYQRLREQSAQETEREHHEIKQFVYSLRNKPSTQVE
jgi:tetratricopeptide (TPR) repeat protein